jgi:hypothetical protein
LRCVTLRFRITDISSREPPIVTSFRTLSTTFGKVFAARKLPV